ncbi:MAG: hypothetical protein DRP71_17925 [Verrucomicrobia bacterium]|nr:MAG: hypothetical protein DRP71_17925 [Verrucomicrobiota bacterium]
MGLGQLGYCLAVVGLIQFLPDLGLDAVMRHDILQNPRRTSSILYAGLLMRFGAALVGYAMIIGIAVLILDSAVDRTMLLILGAILFNPVGMVASSWFHSQLNAGPAVRIQISVLMAGAVLRVGLVVLGAPVVAFAGAITAEFLVAGVWTFLLASSSGMPALKGAFDPFGAGSLLRRAAPLLLASFSVLVCSKIDIILIKALLGEVAAGHYVGACRLSESWYPMVAAITMSMLPRLVSLRIGNRDNHFRASRAVLDYSVILSLLFVVPVALGANWIVVLLYGEAFSPAGSVLRIHIWTVLFLFLASARNQWVITEGLTRLLLPISLLTVLTNLVLDLALIPSFGITGAAWGTLAAFALASVVSTLAWKATRAYGVMQVKAVLWPWSGLVWLLNGIFWIKRGRPR